MDKAKQEYAEYLQSEYWQIVSSEVKRRAGFRCQVCNSQKELQAHHRTYEHRGIELEHLEDLTCLCKKCHQLFHGTLDLAPKPYVHEDRVKLIRENRIRRLVKYMGMDETELVKKTDAELKKLNHDRKAMRAAQRYGLV